MVLQDQAEYLTETQNMPSQSHAIPQEWRWAGMGADVPTLVPGLQGVKTLSLGSMHAMAVIG